MLSQLQVLDEANPQCSEARPQISLSDRLSVVPWSHWVIPDEDNQKSMPLALATSYNDDHLNCVVCVNTPSGYHTNIMSRSLPFLLCCHTIGYIATR